MSSCRQSFYYFFLTFVITVTATFTLLGEKGNACGGGVGCNCNDIDVVKEVTDQQDMQELIKEVGEGLTEQAQIETIISGQDSLRTTFGGSAPDPTRRHNHSTDQLINYDNFKQDKDEAGMKRVYDPKNDGVLFRGNKRIMDQMPSENMGYRLDHNKNQTKYRKDFMFDLEQYQQAVRYAQKEGFLGPETGRISRSLDNISL